MTPLFIFSLPRSGSTLLQRVLGSHEAISTASEPWILLPCLYSLRKKGCYAEYDHRTLCQAVEDFCETLPRGKADYLDEIRKFALQLYTKASAPGARYFLDKTPRYHLIATELMDLFRSGKFIFLWRNPLATVASIMETWAEGRWNLYLYKVDLFDGLANLLSVYEQHTGEILTVRFEDLVEDPESTCKNVFNYLELDADPETIKNSMQLHLEGNMGDHSGTKKYMSISQQPLEKWKLVLSNPIRKAWCRHYLRWIGKDRLAIMGYDLDALLSELEAIPRSMRFIGSDTSRIGFGIAYCMLEPRIMLHKVQALPAWRRVYSNK